MAGTWFRPCPHRLSGDRELQQERRSRAAVRIDPDSSVHARHELAGDVEPEPGAADAAGQVRVEAKELLEDPVLLGGRDAEALIGHAEPDASPAPGDLDLD